MSSPLPKAALQIPSVVSSRVQSEEVPLLAEGDLSREQQARAAAWLGVPLGAVLEQLNGQAPLVLASSKDEQSLEALRAQLAALQLPSHTEKRLVSAQGSPGFTLGLTAILASPLLFLTGLIELIGLATPLGPVAQGLAIAAGLLYLGLVMGLPWRKARNKARRAAYNAPLEALDDALAKLSVADPEAAGLRDRALALRRAVLSIEISVNARDDLLSGLEEVLVSLEELGLERAKVQQSLGSESAQRVRRKVREVGEPAEGSALASALRDLGALEAHRKSLSQAITHIDHELDALEMAIARLDTSDDMRTEAELAGLIERTREARRASEEVISARIPALPRVRTLS